MCWPARHRCSDHIRVGCCKNPIHNLEGENNDTAAIFDKVVDLHVQLSNESLATIGKQKISS